MSGQSSSTRYCSRCLTTFEEDQERCPNLACRRPRPQSGWGRMFGPGDLFDRHYRIHNLLALGGAGVTYLAREVGGDGEEIGPRLALKVLFASRDEGPYLRRLATEAQIIQELNHANIVQYLGFVHRAGHSPYLVTRFESGGSLLDHIKRVGSMPVRKAALVARQVCWALDKAHGMGIVHRDLKPENVLLSRIMGPEEDPVIRVADFGIAKVQGALGSQTRVGAFVGTPQYAAPEQFIGGNPSPATDVYGVGALLYFCCMVSSVVRFADRLDPEEGYQLLVDALPPSVVRSHDDPEDVRRLNRILEISMDPDPLRRCTVDQLDGLLGNLLAGNEPDVEAARPARAKTGPTQAPEPDTQERARAADPRITTPFPKTQADGSIEKAAPPPEDTSSVGLLAGLAATAALGVAAAALAARSKEAAASEPPPPPRTATVSPQLGSPSLAGPSPTVQTERIERPTPPAASPPIAEPAPRRSALSCLVGVPLAGGALLGGLALLWVGLVWSAPQLLPGAMKPGAEALDGARPAHARLLAQAQEGLLARGPALHQRCGVKKAHLTVSLIVEPSGAIRSMELRDLSAGLDPRCASEVLSDLDLPSPGWRAARFALELDL